MSGPFVYNPGPSYPTYQSSHYIDPAIYGTPIISPFIPNIALSGGAVYPPSPYATALTTPLPPSPRYGDVTLDWAGYPDDYQRQRRPSWHGAKAPPSPNFLSPTFSGHKRSRSFGASAAAAPGYAPPWTSWASFNTQVPISALPFRLHPWLNGEESRNDFRFDLSIPSFTPQKLVDSFGTFTLLSREELVHPATYPSITRLRIVCDLLPQWPMDLEPVSNYANSGAVPPLLFQDVLVMIHRSMHLRISHRDWAQLHSGEQQAIAKAFDRRCASFGPMESQARNDGVKRVDYLRGKVWFRGLVPTAEPNTMRLVLA